MNLGRGASRQAAIAANHARTGEGLEGLLKSEAFDDLPFRLLSGEGELRAKARSAVVC